MAESIISAPSVKDLERAIEIEAAKSNPDFNVIKELVDASKTILEQSGGPLRPPTKQETISKYVSQEPISKQLLRGIQTAPERAFQGLFSGSDAMQPVATPTGRYSAPTLPPAPAPTKEEIEQTKMIRQATPYTQGGGIAGDIALFAPLPARAINALSMGQKLTSRAGQALDVAATGAATQAATSPEDRMTAAMLGSLGGVVPAITGGTQRALPQSMGGVSRPQTQGEIFLRDFGNDSENLIRALKSDYLSVPGVSGSSAVVTRNPLLQSLETGSRTSQGDLWIPHDIKNETARFNALINAAGTKAEREVLAAERDRVTSLLRERAFKEAETTPDTLSMAPSINKMRETVYELKTGENRPNPAVQKISSYVERELFNPEGTTPQQLYTVRKVLTGQIKAGANDEIGAAAAAARKETLQLVNQIDDTLNSLSGGKWSDYLQKYGDMSKELSSKTALQNAIDDMTVNLAMGRVPPSLSGKTGESTLSRAVNKYALKDFGSKTIDQLTPEHRALVEALKKDLEANASAMNFRATGGPGTAQYLASSNKSKQLAKQLAETVVGSSIAGPAGGVAANAAGSIISNALSKSDEGAKILARLLQDPKYLAAMLEKAKKSQTQMDIASQLGIGTSGAAESLKPNK